MKEIPHCELEQYHYKALKNPFYALACQLEVLREEMMMNMPVWQVSPPAEEPKEHIVIHRHSNMSAEEFDMLQQASLKADYLEKRLNELQAKRKPKGKY